jgi:CheY-like chemotaxis protein
MVEENNRVMLVDDDDTNNFICKRMLAIFDPNIQVIEFIDPEAALAFFNQEYKKDIKLLLLDINMPKINAWQFLEHLEDRSQEYDIIILTSSIDPKDRMRAKQMTKIKGFWTKPLSLEMIDNYFSNNFTFFS